MALDPVTAGLELAAKVIEKLSDVYLALLAAGSPEQKARIVEAWLEDREFWRRPFKDLPKG